MILFKNVHKEYPRTGYALQDVSFHLRKGEFMFVTGPSGAGKTTLVKLVTMEERPTAGTVRISGYASDKIKTREIPALRRRLGIVFQDFRLLKNRTARENVAFALEVTGASAEQINPKVLRTLAAVGLSDKADHLPSELSGGEQQRVAIARALVNDPFILLADEPTGNLDPKVALDILRVFKDINLRGMAVLLVTHDRTLLGEHPRARIIELDQGRIVRDTANGGATG
ncbi:MAG TPA: cell division ATP-binding protein FtsE [Gemmatimonadota bacterium]|nr:cell division ATP-binding protein FtsE [Gemmatimonadota bacterium]